MLRDNIYQSENVVSPFVLGIIKPTIYLPFNIDKQDINHVITHENAHIRRKDHWWKPFGFLVLTLHWFNPLMWIGYVLLCRDIEFACDEKVVKEFNNEQKADYSQALLTCSVNRRIIAACPIAFGEVGVKNRVKSVLNYKKPAFWIVVAAIVASIVVAICFLTNPKTPIEDELKETNTSETTELSEYNPDEDESKETITSEPTESSEYNPDEDEKNFQSIDTNEETQPSSQTEFPTTPGTLTVEDQSNKEESETEWEKFFVNSSFDGDTSHYLIYDDGEEVFNENSSIKHLSGTATLSNDGDYILDGENLGHISWMNIGYNDYNGGLYLGISMSLYHLTADAEFVGICSSVVTKSYDGSIVKDNAELANKHFSITINVNPVTIKSVVMGKGNGHQDCYFALDTDIIRYDIKEITFECKAQ